jgi:hypothetical protein
MSCTPEFAGGREFTPEFDGTDRTEFCAIAADRVKNKIVAEMIIRMGLDPTFYG